jgi:hypothetical protein
VKSEIKKGNESAIGGTRVKEHRHRLFVRHKAVRERRRGSLSRSHGEQRGNAMERDFFVY